MNLQKVERLAPFMAGLGIGVAASLLLAPETGDNTRNRIRNMASRVGNGLKDRAEKFGDLKNKAKQKIDGAADDVRAAADSFFVGPR